MSIIPSYGSQSMSVSKLSYCEYYYDYRFTLISILLNYLYVKCIICRFILPTWSITSNLRVDTYILLIILPVAYKITRRNLLYLALISNIYTNMDENLLKVYVGTSVMRADLVVLRFHVGTYLPNFLRIT